MSTVRLEALGRGPAEIPLQSASYDIWDKNAQEAGQRRQLPIEVRVAPRIEIERNQSGFHRLVPCAHSIATSSPRRKTRLGKPSVRMSP